MALGLQHVNACVVCCVTPGPEAGCQVVVQQAGELLCYFAVLADLQAAASHKRESRCYQEAPRRRLAAMQKGVWLIYFVLIIAGLQTAEVLDP
jgi:hypothetical protein